jgi:hypothetical protein
MVEQPAEAVACVSLPCFEGGDMTLSNLSKDLGWGHSEEVGDHGAEVRAFQHIKK